MSNTRNSLVHLVRTGIEKPAQIFPYLRRRARNVRLRFGTKSHPEFYRGVMSDDFSRRGGTGAVGTIAEKDWLRIGKMQFDYLTSHGLDRSDRILEVGCGNLRAGWRFIEFLDSGNYVGVDISPEILIDATRTIGDRGLQERTPRLYLYDGLDLSFLPDGYFDVVHAHSVFSHTPPEVVSSLLGEARRVLKPGGFFDFTYNQSQTGKTWGFLAEDYYYPADELIGMCAEAGLVAQPAQEWTYVQDKIRAARPLS